VVVGEALHSACCKGWVLVVSLIFESLAAIVLRWLQLICIL
jgi:hypothetical protein